MQHAQLEVHALHQATLPLDPDLRKLLCGCRIAFHVRDQGDHAAYEKAFEDGQRTPDTQKDGGMQAIPEIGGLSLEATPTKQKPAGNTPSTRAPTTSPRKKYTPPKEVIKGWDKAKNRATRPLLQTSLDQLFAAEAGDEAKPTQIDSDTDSGHPTAPASEAIQSRRGKTTPPWQRKSAPPNKQIARADNPIRTFQGWTLRSIATKKLE